jgi:lysophospholipase L1-like esterase
MIYIRDGVHPNENGQKIMAKYVTKAIKELI